MSAAIKKPRPVALAPALTAANAGDTFDFAPSLVLLSNPFGAASEAIRALRTHLAAQHLQEGRRALALCAAGEGAGCTFTAANLAVAFAQAGVRTMLIDADLRRPGINELIQPSGRIQGLAQYLASEDVDLSDNIVNDVLPDLSVMYSGGPAASPQELLAGERFKSLIDFTLREYDLTIIDTPPANTCADARRVSTVAGYSLVVTRKNLTYVDDVKTLIGQLHADHARVIGTVLNEG
ncbi:MAG: chain length determinant protein tyrosine kinase EpsG [Caulobacteraceae bacterium]|nr:chain length determinant protein tyrosine kinase EpsG [Caulobacteraceae bacterium]